MARPRVLTWHVHGSYLWYLSFCAVDWYLPVRAGRPSPWNGLVGARQWPATMHEVADEEVDGLHVDCVLFQSAAEWAEWGDRLPGVPRVFLEHDPPRQSPTDTRHPVEDPHVTVVHCTPFNRLMWDCGEVPTRVVEHGVRVPDGIEATGELARGLVVVNHLGRRGRRLGLDVFEDVRRQGVALDLVGMGSEELGGLGEVAPPDLPAFAAPYRFLFNPIRYTSLGLAVLEAMAVGVPVVGLATTEHAVAIENGLSGYVDTDVDRLVGHMRRLIDDPALAWKLGEGAREAARRRYGIERFARDWEAVFADVTGRVATAPSAAATGAAPPTTTR
ncbi:MAG: glycosyltransferase [Acidimicrobiia bacterium]